MSLVLILLVLFLLAGSVLGWVAFLKIRSLTAQLDQLRRTLRAVVDRLDSLQPDAAIKAADHQEKPVSDSAASGSEPEYSRSPGGDVWTGPGRLARPRPASTSRTSTRSRQNPPAWIASVKEQWMIWLGGLSVSLAGIFLVRYSIEQGLLGPAARVTLAVLTGLALHGAAEWLRRHNKGHYNAFAALAGGASIMLYAALLAALLLYQLLPPLVIFVLLAVVSLFTLSLALVHGPVLAILGILGAYVVPLLVDTGSDSIVGLYLYSLIISAAALLLMRHVYRPWLWLGMLAGAVGWWLLSLTTMEAAGYRGYYLAALAYLLLALPRGDWTLHRGEINSDHAGVTRPVILQSLALLVALLPLGLLAETTLANAIYYWSPLVIVLGVAGGSRLSLRWLPAASLVLQLLAWLVRGLEPGNGWRPTALTEIDQHSFLLYAGWMTVLYVLLSGYNYLRDRRSLWVALIVMTPLTWLSLSYLLVTDLSQSIYWGALALILGLVYLGLAFWRLRQSSPIEPAAALLTTTNTVWLIMAGHFAYSLAVAIVVREATLTLALAAQLVSLTWLLQKFRLPGLALLIKAVLAVVVTRLTVNPWLLSYPDDVHWSLWTYGGSTLLAALASRLVGADHNLRKWLEAATLHLLVLTLWAETRYWLYDGNVFALRFELTEFAINTAVWSSLALVYYRRHLAGQLFAGWYRFASRILLGLATFSYGLVLLPLNPAWGGAQVSGTPVFNLLLLAYGFPVIINLLLYRFYDPGFKRYFAYAASFTGFVFINLEIRQLWQGSVNLSLATGNGELYTYTIVWLLVAILALLLGALRSGKQVYQGGMALLLLVVAKIFLVDMADLEGLLRVTAFMGLGLSLLGLAYLYQRFNLANRLGRVNESGSE
ncbi:MAG: DUF2339 domain-containing protein [Gammaproteobacteria bacterium]|nr:DUF2339 domain-containing protein [Pseudomonadales bacterium]MCP5348464.1 DUF2339 domain-containing protein [Pseudomonadales bacterium]